MEAHLLMKERMAESQYTLIGSTLMFILLGKRASINFMINLLLTDYGWIKMNLMPQILEKLTLRNHLLNTSLIINVRIEA